MKGGHERDYRVYVVACAIGFALVALQQGLQLSDEGRTNLWSLIALALAVLLMLSLRQRWGMRYLLRASATWSLGITIVVLASGGLASCFFELPRNLR